MAHGGLMHTCFFRFTALLTAFVAVLIFFLCICSLFCAADFGNNLASHDAMFLYCYSCMQTYCVLSQMTVAFKHIAKACLIWAVLWGGRHTFVYIWLLYHLFTGTYMYISVWVCIYGNDWTLCMIVKPALAFHRFIISFKHDFAHPHTHMSLL